MRLSKIRALYKSHIADKSYQFKNLTPEEMLEAASKAYYKLTETQKQHTQKSWKALLATEGEELTPENAKELVLFRFLCQTNLFFLCKVLERYAETTEKTHEEICNEFFTPRKVASGTVGASALK